MGCDHLQKQGTVHHSGQLRQLPQAEVWQRTLACNLHWPPIHLHLLPLLLLFLLLPNPGFEKEERGRVSVEETRVARYFFRQKNGKI